MTDLARQIADALIAARRTGQPLAHEDLSPVGDTSVAYAVQSLVADEFGPVGGYKAGRAGPDAPLKLAPIFARDILANGATIQFAQSRLRGVELEVGFRITAPLPSVDAVGFTQALAAAVTPLVVLEIVESRLVEPQAAGTLWKLADNQINGGIVVGVEGRFEEEREAVLKIGDETVVDGPAANPAGSPLAVLAAFVGLAGVLGIVPRPGQTVLTGSYTGLRYAQQGDRVQGGFSDPDEVWCTFAADPASS